MIFISDMPQNDKLITFSDYFYNTYIYDDAYYWYTKCIVDHFLLFTNPSSGYNFSYISP